MGDVPDWAGSAAIQEGRFLDQNFNFARPLWDMASTGTPGGKKKWVWYKVVTVSGDDECGRMLRLARLLITREGGGTLPDTVG